MSLIIIVCVELVRVEKKHVNTILATVTHVYAIFYFCHFISSFFPVEPLPVIRTASSTRILCFHISSFPSNATGGGRIHTHMCVCHHSVSPFLIFFINISSVGRSKTHVRLLLLLLLVLIVVLLVVIVVLIEHVLLLHTYISLTIK